MMKIMKVIAILLSLFAFSVVADAQSQTAPAAVKKPVTKPAQVPKETLSAIRESGKLRACVSPYAPWVMIGEQESLSGYSIDVAKQLGKDLAVEVEFVQTGYPDLLPE